MENLFLYKGKVYESGAIVKIKEGKEDQFDFCSVLVFDRYDVESKYCVFHCIYDGWRVYNIHVLDLEIVIDSVVPAYSSTKKKSRYKVEEKYIEGIVSAWIWYILAMLLGVVAKGIDNQILVWTAASFVFFTWRRQKLNGG